MIVTKRGKFRENYKIGIVKRGHINRRQFDVVVLFKGCLVEKLGYYRRDNRYGFINIDGGRLEFWVCKGAIFTSSFERLFLRFLAYCY